MAKYNLTVSNGDGSVSVEAIINKLGGIPEALRFLRGEIVVGPPARKWSDNNGVLRFTLPATDGTTGPKWSKRLEHKGYQVSPRAKQVLNSSSFVPTTGVINEIVVLRGMLFNDDDRITSIIRALAEQRCYDKPNAEVACLIREHFTDDEIKEMGLWGIVAMHEPVKDSDGAPLLLVADRDGDGRWLGACYGDPGNRWARGDGFAFVAEQVSA